MDPLHDLGDAVADRWRARDYDEDVLPEIAEGAIRDLEPSRQFTPQGLIAWLQSAQTLPAQFDLEGRFGEPPITVYRHPRFVVDVLFWLDGTTSIHQHSFSGAFHVLHGSSIHSEYEFELTDRVNRSLLLGELSLRGVELLERGATRPIRAGSKLIHSLFHLERPSVSLVVRTISETGVLPQYGYLAPHVAQDPFTDPLQRRRLEGLAVLWSIDPAAYFRLVDEVLPTTDFHTAFRIIVEHAEAVGWEPARLETLLARARKTHGSRVQVIRPVVREVQRQTRIIGQRQLVRGPDARFCLALALNVRSRRDIARFVERRFPGTAKGPKERAAITGLKRELTAATAKGDADEIRRVCQALRATPVFSTVNGA